MWDEPEVLTSAERHMRENGAFHDLIRDLSGNARLAKVVSQLHLPGYRIRFRLLLDGPHLVRSAADHRAIAAAILAGDGDRAAALAQSHGAFANDLLQALPDWEFSA